MGHKPGKNKNRDKPKNSPPVPTPVIKGNEQGAPKTDTHETKTNQTVPQNPTSQRRDVDEGNVILYVFGRVSYCDILEFRGHHT